MTHRSYLVLLTLLALGCDGDPESDAGVESQDGGARLDGGASVLDASAMDAAANDGGGPDAARPPFDGGPGAMPQPPAGTVRCGGASISAAELMTACERFDPIFDVGRGGEKACGELVADGARYEVWCSPTMLYLWVDLGLINDPTLATCDRAFPGPDGGVIRFTSRQFDWVSYGVGEHPVTYELTAGGRHQNITTQLELMSYGITGGEEEPWTGQLVYQETTSVDVSGGGRGIATVSLLRGDCDDNPVPDSQRFVFVVPFGWSMP